MGDDYVWDKTGDAEPDVLALERSLSALRHDRPLRPLPPPSTTIAPSRLGWAKPVLWGALLSSTLTVLLIWAFVRLTATVAPPPAPPPPLKVSAPPVDPDSRADRTPTAAQLAEIHRMLGELQRTVADIDAAVAKLSVPDPRGENRPRAIPDRQTRVDPRKREAPTVDCVLDPTLCKRPAKRAAPDLPEALSPSDIRDSIEPHKEDARQCAHDHGGLPGQLVQVKLTITGATGRVASARATGVHAASPLGNCVAAALRKAVFPRFGKRSLGVQYPIRF